jgi:hypothetical protein
MATPVATAATIEQRSPASVSVALNVNGTTRSLEIEPRVTLLDALREHLHLTRTKKGCDLGSPGVRSSAHWRWRRGWAEATTMTCRLEIDNDEEEILSCERDGRSSPPWQCCSA